VYEFIIIIISVLIHLKYFIDVHFLLFSSLLFHSFQHHHHHHLLLTFSILSFISSSVVSSSDSLNIN